MERYFNGRKDILTQADDILEEIFADVYAGIEMPGENATSLQQFKKAVDGAVERNERIKKTAQGFGNVKFSADVYNQRTAKQMNIAWDENNHSTLKEQLRAHIDEVNEMTPVADVTFEKTSGRSYRDNLNKTLKEKFGYKINREDGISFNFDEKSISDLSHYVMSNEEAAAAETAPYVLKRGKVISGHKNHKGKGQTSLTFAAPVTINGKTGDVAVAVQFSDKGKVHSLTILDQNGNEYKMQAGLGREDGGSKNRQISPTRSAYEENVPQQQNEVKKNVKTSADAQKEKTEIIQQQIEGDNAVYYSLTPLRRDDNILKVVTGCEVEK